MNSEIALRRLNGSHAMLAAMAGFFLEDAPALFEMLQDAVRDRSFQQIVRAAHNLRGLASTFEPVIVMQIAQEIEDRAKTGQELGLAELVGHLGLKLGQLSQELRELQN